MLSTKVEMENKVLKNKHLGKSAVRRKKKPYPFFSTLVEKNLMMEINLITLSKEERKTLSLFSNLSRKKLMMKINLITLLK
jgi:hypothetical protein